MTRQARVISESGIHHIIIRGINKQILFEDAEDFSCFCRILRNCKSLNDISVIAFVLMNNHVHMIIRDLFYNMASFMKSVELRYSKYYNKKYERVGSLFQDRYVNIPIIGDRQLYNTAIYILRNPERAGICDFREYKWSSMREFNDDFLSITDISFLSELIGDMSVVPTDEELKMDLCTDNCRRYITDSDALEIIKQSLCVDSGTALLKYEKEKRNNSIKLLFEKGLSIRQIERLTGVSRGVIQKSVKR